MVRQANSKSVYTRVNQSWNAVSKLPEVTPSGHPSEPDPTLINDPYLKPRGREAGLDISSLRDRVTVQEEELNRLRTAVKDKEESCRRLETTLVRYREAAARTGGADDTGSWDPNTRVIKVNRGDGSGRVMDLEVRVSELNDELQSLRARLSKEKARAEDADQKAAHYYKKWVEANRRNQMYRGPGAPVSGGSVGRGGRLEIDINITERITELEAKNSRLEDENSKLRSHLKRLQGDGGSGAESDELRRRIRELEDMLARFRDREADRERGAGVGAGAGGKGGKRGATPPPASGSSGQYNPLRWELEPAMHDGRELLIDRRTNVVYVVDPGDGSKPWPRPVGHLRGSSFVLFDPKDTVSAFFVRLDGFLKEQRTRLDQLFDELDRDKSKTLDGHEFKEFIRRVMVNPLDREVSFLGVLLDPDGNGHVTYEELISTIRDLLQGRGDASKAVECITRIASYVGRDLERARGIFKEMDADGSGEVDYREVLGALKRFVPDLTAQDTRFLLELLFLWDVDGNGQTSFEEFVHALKLGEWVRVRPAPPPSEAWGGGAGGAGGVSDKALLAELEMWRRKCEALESELLKGRRAEVESDDLRAALRAAKKELEDREAYYRGIEAKYLTLDAMLAGFGDPSVEKRLRALAEQNHAQIKRLNELDLSIRTLHVNYQRVVAELDAKTSELAKMRERARENESSVLTLRAELEGALGYKERYESELRRRVDMENAKNQLQLLALETPALAQEELNRVRLELVQLKAKLEHASASEAALRRQVEQLLGAGGGGSTGQSNQALNNEVLRLKRLLQQKEAQLEEAEDKLAVHLRSGGQPNLSAALLEMRLTKDTDAGRSDDDLRRELRLLREDFARLEDERRRAMALLDREQRVSRELEARKAQLEVDLRSLEAELSAREAQLAAALEKLAALSRANLDANDAARAAQAAAAAAASASAAASSPYQNRASLPGPPAPQPVYAPPSPAQVVPSRDGELSSIGDYQNVLELKVYAAELDPGALLRTSTDRNDLASFSTFVCVSFYQHPPQLSLVTGGLEPVYDTAFEFLLDVPSMQTYQALVKYMSDTALRVEVYRSQGYRTELLGTASVALRKLLEDLVAGQGVVQLPRLSDIAREAAQGGEVLGRLKYSLRVLKPFPREVIGAWAAARGLPLGPPPSLVPGPAASLRTSANVAPTGFYTGDLVVHVDRVDDLRGHVAGAGSKAIVYLTVNGAGQKEHINTRPKALVGGQGAPGRADFKESHLLRLFNAPLYLSTGEMLAAVVNVVEEDGKGGQRVLGQGAAPIKPVTEGIPASGPIPLRDPKTGAYVGTVHLDLSRAPQGHRPDASAKILVYNGSMTDSAPPPRSQLAAPPGAADSMAGLPGVADSVPHPQPQPYHQGQGLAAALGPPAPAAQAPLPGGGPASKVYKLPGVEPPRWPSDDGSHVVVGVQSASLHPEVLADSRITKVSIGYDFLRNLEEVYRSPVAMLPVIDKAGSLAFNESHVYDCRGLAAYPSLLAMLSERRPMVWVLYAILDEGSGHTQLLGTYPMDLSAVLGRGTDLENESLPLAASDGREVGRVTVTLRLVNALRRSLQLGAASSAGVSQY